MASPNQLSTMLLIPSGTWLSSFFCLLPSSTATQPPLEALTVTLHGSWIERIQAGGEVFEAWRLRPGISTGAVLESAGSFDIRAADGRDLGFYFAREGGAASWDIDLGVWRNSNEGGLDFFLFEYGGNDDVSVAPRLMDGSLGQAVPLPSWTSTGYVAYHGPNQNQTAHAVAFGFDLLRDANGAPLGVNTLISGLRLVSSSVDGAAFLAHDSSPPPGGPGAQGLGISWLSPASPRAWKPLELSFHGPWASATAVAPNPFLDRRLRVRFEGPGGLVLEVPGFFDGDGRGALGGFVWRARFTAPVPGLWQAEASFREGSQVAIALEPSAGSPGALDGASHSFWVAEPKTTGPALSPQRYSGEHYARGLDGKAFLKGGTNSPENFLACRGFVAIEKSPGGIGILHDFEPHRADWTSGDPVFQSDVHAADGKGIIGALNYLSSVGVNSLFAMLMNLGGDGRDVHPFLGPRPATFDKTHFHVGRLAQWNVVFEHAARRGIALHLGLAETESGNETWLDGGELGVERKLFYREMVARFAHLPSIKWNLCEETNFYTAQDLRDFSEYLRAQDAYSHPVAFHNDIDDLSLYEQLAGDPAISATSLQYTASSAGDQAEYLRQLSASAGQPWIVQLDEVTPASTGLSPSNAGELRRTALYDILFSGGHLEWYLGWIGNEGGGDLDLEDFRTREEMWNYMRYARRLLEDTLPFWRMQPMDHLLTGESSLHGGGEVFAAPGEAYAVFLPSATSAGILQLSGMPGLLERRWFDPRQGVFAGTADVVLGGVPLVLGPPPYALDQDWVVILRRPGLPRGPLK